MFEQAVVAPAPEERIPALPDRPEGWTAEDEQLFAEESYRRWARTALPEPPPAHEQPSGWAAFELDTGTTDPSQLSDAGLIDAMVGFERLAAWAEARQARLVAEFARRRPTDDPTLAGSDRISATSPYAPDEVGLALRLSRWSAKGRIGQSLDLVHRLPETLQVWENGQIDERRVTAICDATRRLSTEHARAVQHRVLARAPEQTLAQLKAALSRAVLAVDPNGGAERHRRARRDRRVAVGAESDGMASLWALLSAPDARSAYQWLSRLARGIGTDDPRGMDARRADLLVDLLTGRLTYAPPTTGTTDTDRAEFAQQAATTGSGAAAVPPLPVNPGKPLVQVIMPFTTLMGADDQPCELVGHGAVPADLAREIAADAVLKRLVYDPLSGALLDHGRTTYRPPAALRDFLRARDVHCRSPICRRRAIDAELDHVVPYPQGTTSADNMAACCSHDHHMKHAPGWQVRIHDDGGLEWTTPTGHRYLSHPYDYRPDTGSARAQPAPPGPATPDGEGRRQRLNPRPDAAGGATAGPDPEPPPF
ncbi:DUF222 domain-containing protein [Pseudonocardia xinjiangensis]|uniref:HNH endonuclease signature motif containing protein n=1 Tax=Pseudonocardia xinjiangensis TaxID=75289 RepID=UPI003D8EE998